MTCLDVRVSPSISSLYLKLLSIHLPSNVANTDMLAVNLFDFLPTFVINMFGFIVHSEQIIKTVQLFNDL